MNHLIDKAYQVFYRVAYHLLRCAWFFIRPSVQGVNVAIWIHEKVLLVKPSYKREYAMPGGYIKRGEDKRSAAMREVSEELNLSIPRDGLTCVNTYLNTHEYKRDTTTIFEIRLQAPPPIVLDQREIVQSRWVSPEEAFKLELPPSIRAYLQTKQLQFRRASGRGAKLAPCS
jgi:8-oxo-dGTP pyrophosphatase MutT (NUDIX family)